MIRVALIDDHVALTDAMALLLNDYEDIAVVGIENDFMSGLKMINHLTIDVVIIDMNIGKEDSCDLIEESVKCDVIPLVLSAYSDVSMIKRAMRAGAKGYISKTTAANNIVKGILSVIRGNVYYDSIVQSVVNNLIVHSSNNLVSIPEIPSLTNLTAREKDIIRLIALEYTSDEIAKELFLSKNTIDSYRKNLISKLQLKNSVGLGIYAIRNGLI